MANLAAPSNIESFDFGFQFPVDRKQIKDLLTLRFLADGTNVVRLCPPQASKTPLAMALGMAACQAGHAVHFATGQDLSQTL